MLSFPGVLRTLISFLTRASSHRLWEPVAVLRHLLRSRAFVFGAVRSDSDDSQPPATMRDSSRRRLLEAQLAVMKHRWIEGGGGWDRGTYCELFYRVRKVSLWF